MVYTRHVRKFTVHGLGAADDRNTTVFRTFLGAPRTTAEIDCPATSGRRRIILAAFYMHTRKQSTSAFKRRYITRMYNIYYGNEFFTRFRRPLRRGRRDSTLLAYARRTCRFSDTRQSLRRP